MHDLHFLHDIVILFGTAVVVIAASSRLHVPPVIGFLLTGVVVGPHGLGGIDDVERVKVFAELGVVFLLFIVGLELSPSRLRKLGRTMLVGGSLQTAVTVAAVAGLGLALGYPPAQAVFFSFIVTLSSTAIVLKLYSERRELEMPHGETAMGILLFQDFLIVPLLMVVPVLAGAGQATAAQFAARFGGGLLAVGLFFAAGRYLLPHVLHVIVYTRIRELFVIGALFACLGAAILTESLGFSLALGAFVAGLMIAESEYRYQVLAETAPFRDVFNSMFFISVGMLLSLDFAREHALAIAAVGTAVIAVKVAGTLLAGAALPYTWRTRLLCAFGLAQVSEFSFVLINAGEHYGLLDPLHYQLAIATSVFTMLLTPVFVALGPRLATVLTRADAPAMAAAAGAEPHGGQVVVVGYGHNGQRVSRALAGEGIAYAIVEANGRAVRAALAEGEPILYGDVTRREIQEKAGIEAAQIAVFSVSDRLALRDGVRLARSLNPGLFILARARTLEEGRELRARGADEVVVDDLETAVKSLALTLTRLRVSDERVRAQIGKARASGAQGADAGGRPVA